MDATPELASNAADSFTKLSTSEDRKDREDREAVFQDLAASPLSTHEREIVDAFLRQHQMPSSELTFVGRLILWDDVYLFADDMIESSARPVDKGFTLIAPDTTTAGTPGQLAASPNQYSRLLNGVYQFYRPDVSNQTYYVVSDGVPWLVTLVSNALDEWATAADDCLFPGNPFIVTDRTTWNTTYGPIQNFTPRVEVEYGPRLAVCPGSSVASRGCALFPRFGLPSNRMVLGPRIGLPSNIVVPSGNTGTRHAIAHEIGHTLGLAHPFTALTSVAKATPPGTNNSADVISVMQNFCEPTNVAQGCSATIGVSADDALMIDTLYSPQAGGDCSYVSGFQTIAGVCPPNGIQNGNICCPANLCSFCGGNGCSRQPGGSDNCCAAGVDFLDRPCGTYGPPCEIMQQ